MVKLRKKVIIPSLIALFIALIAYLTVFAPAALMIATGHYRLEKYSEDRICDDLDCGIKVICTGWIVEGACWEHRIGFLNEIT
ncbi:hypothetical protein KC950_01430 [Candidatus Saccharibacteria bacterium]|nr:hypothetical protein [Candidatus Saccharibacteria bacterium]